MKTKLKTYPAFIIMAVVIGVDQFTKFLVRANIRLNDFIPVGKNIWGDFFRLDHLQNNGAAFSLSLFNPAGNRIFLICTSIVAVIFILWLLYHATHKIQVWAFGLILGGAISNNLIDRPILGAVTDFLDFDIPNIIKGMDRFPVFNLADTSIFIAMCLILIDLIFIRDIKVTEPETEPDTIPADVIVNKEQ